MIRLPSRCLLSLLLLSGCARPEKAAGSSAEYLDAPVIIISIDTLRADHLPAYGYSAVSTPNFDILQRESIRFSNAYSNVPLTLPSHVSMLTGLLPPEHGVRNNLGYTFESGRFPSIATVLKSRGYDTGAAVSAYVLRRDTGLATSFDFYEDGVIAKGGEAFGAVQRSGQETLAACWPWIEAHKRSKVFFLLHLFEPHSPYAPPEPFLSRYGSTYDGEIAAADAVLGTFLDKLRSAEIYDRALIIVLSDHGEGLSQHGEAEHGIFLYREALHVPLFVKLPGGRRGGETVNAPVQLIDIPPTVYQLVGAKVPDGVKGTSLLTGARPPQRKIYGESLYPRIHLGWSELRSLIDENHHYIEAPRPELYDLSSDLPETSNVLESERRVYSGMRKEMEKYDRTFAPPAAVKPEEAAKLQALGYLGSASRGGEGPLPDPKDHIADLSIMEAAVGLDSSGNPDGAIAALRAFLAKNPRVTDAYTRLATILEKQGRWEEAIEVRRSAIELSPALASELALNMAVDHLNIGKTDEAELYAGLALSTNPASARLQLARVAMARRDWPVAEREAKIAMKDPGIRPAAMVALAQTYTLQRPRRLEEALQILGEAKRESVSRGSPIGSLEFARGDALARLNRSGEAIQAFREEIRLFPHNLQAYATLSVIHILAGDPAKARDVMEQMVRSNPSSRAYDLAARTFEELGQSEESARWRSLARRR